MGVGAASRIRYRDGMDWPTLASYRIAVAGQGKRGMIPATGVAMVFVCCALAAACGPSESVPPRQTPATSLPAVLVSDGETQPVVPATWPGLLCELADGMEGASCHLVGDGAMAIELAHLRFEPVIVGVGNRSRGGVTARGQIASGMRIVLGSGFVSEFRPIAPLGLLQIDGTVVSELSSHGYTRIIGLRDGVLDIIGRADYHRGLFTSAMQVGPGVVELGKLDISERELNLPAHFRAFVARCEASTLVGVTLKPMHLYHLGGDLLATFEAAGLDCAEVANISGDLEALLAVRSGERTLYIGDPDSPKASLIGWAQT